jgi:glycosyltransferase involved in cell wall biosynthesis
MPVTSRFTETCFAAEGSPSAGRSLVVFADDWGRHPSSCQHLVRRLRGDYRILWVNSVGTRQVKANAFTLRRGWEKIQNWRRGLHQVSEQMWVIDLPMLPNLGSSLVRETNRRLATSRLKRILSKLHMDTPIVLTTLPYMDWLIRDIPRRVLVYYCTDDYSFWPSSDREMMQRADHEMSGRADLILAASQALVRQHDSTGRCHYFPHGVDLDHFKKVQEPQDLQADLARLPGLRIGFFGLIYEKLDFELLGAVARRFPACSLVLIGPVVHCPAELTQLPNVHLLGPKPYEMLPRYLAGLDVLLLPYVDDPMIRQSGPLKLRECLAAGKPTVSIDVPDVRPFQPHVRIGRNPEAFLEEIRQCLAEPQDLNHIKARQHAVAQDGWDCRAQLLRSFFERRQNGDVEPAAKPFSNGAPKRILHLRTVSGRGGGPEKTLLNSPRFLEGAYQLRLLYVRPHGDRDYNMPERARRMGVDLVDVPEHGAADPRTVIAILRQVNSFQPDILHAHDYKTNLLALLLGRLFGIRVITTLHGYVTRGGRLEAYYQLDRWALRFLDHVVAVSPDLRDFLANMGIPRSRYTLIENGIDAEEFQRRRQPAAAKQLLGIDSKHLVIGAVGRLYPEKGFDLLIRAVDKLLKAGLCVKLLIVGEGEHRLFLEHLIEDLGRKQDVQLLGYRSDTRDLYEAMDVFALSSLREGLPNVLLEAMAMEVPVVASRVAAVPGVIADGENGLLVDPGSETQLTQALERLLGEPALRARFRKEGRHTVETRYTFARRIQKIQGIYDALLAKKTC